MRKENTSGKLIVVEGMDGSGKSTLCTALADRYNKYNPLVLHSPGSTKLGKAFEKFYGNNSLLDLMLHLTDRVQLIQEKIIPALKEGRLIICDRFNESTIAYQGYGGKISINSIRKMCNFICKGILVDYCIYLHISLEAAAMRKKIENSNEMRNVEFGYNEITKSKASRYFVVDATQKIEKVQQLVFDRLDKGLFKFYDKKIERGYR